jgi:glycosyltransferase 2 family protein
VARIDSGRPAGISVRRVAVALLIGIPASALFLYLASRGLNYHDVRRALGRAELGWLIVAVALMACVYVVQTLRWQRIARHEGTFSLRRGLRWVIGCVAINNVVPGRPGELFRAYWLGDALHIPKARALATVLVDRAADVLTLVAGLLIAYPFTPHPAWLRHLDLVAIPIGIAIIAILAWARWHTKRRDESRQHDGWLRRQFSQLVQGAARVVTRDDIPAIAALSALAWTLWAAAAWVVAYSLGISLTLPEMLFITAMINLGSAIPSSPGFVGTYQWLSVAGLGLFGVGHAEAFAFAIVLQAVWFIPTTIAGLVLFAQTVMNRSNAERRRVGAAMHDAT